MSAERDLDPMDVHLGARVREGRLKIGMSQSQLARLIGLSYQQVQKEEKGQNRISASQLFQIAMALELPIEFFFEGVGGRKVQQATIGAYDREMLQLTRLWQKLPRQERLDLMRLIKTRVKDDPHAA